MSSLPQLVDSKLSLSDRVAVLTMSRDDMRNALTGTALVDDIVAAATWANETMAVSVMILTGTGSSFSAGGNIKDMQARRGLFSGSTNDIERNYRQGVQRMTLAMDALEVPVIAAVNGAAVGAGLDLACMCDLSMASNQAVVGESFINLGLIPGDGGTWYLQRLVGYQRAAELTFTGRVINAEEAHSLGIFLDVVAHEELMPRAMELARKIASKPPEAVRLTKRLLRMARTRHLEDVLQKSAVYQAILHQTEDHMEAVHAFLEKRDPHFHGR